SLFLSLLLRPPPRSPLFPYTTLFRSSPTRSSVRTTGCSARWAKRIWNCSCLEPGRSSALCVGFESGKHQHLTPRRRPGSRPMRRSEEHTSELQSREKLVCRLLLEKKK